jgi:hypothetical protein
VERELQRREHEREQQDELLGKNPRDQGAEADGGHGDQGEIQRDAALEVGEHSLELLVEILDARVDVTRPQILTM